MPEELIHRPFVWVYFVAVTFWVGLAWHHLHGPGWPKMHRVRPFWFGLGVLLLATPIHFGKRLQTMPSWGRGYETLPSCLYGAALHVKTTSSPTTIIQVQGGDPTFAFTALSERASWAVDSGGYRTPDGLKDRLQFARSIEGNVGLEQAMHALTAAGVGVFVATNKSELTWWREQTTHPDAVTFECGKVAVIKVPQHQ